MLQGTNPGQARGLQPIGRKSMTDSPRKDRPVHRRRQSLRHGQGARLRHRLQAAAEGIPEPRLPAPRLLLHGADRGSGIFLDPPADRLARLQRLHGRHQADQGVHRLDRPPQGQGQHGHRAGGRRHGAGRAHRPHGALLRRRRLPLAGRGGAAQRRARVGRVDRLAPSRRWSPTSCAARPTSSSTSPTLRRQDRPRPGRARPPASGDRTPNFLRRPRTTTATA